MDPQNPTSSTMEWHQSQAAFLHVDPEPEPIPFQPAKITDTLTRTRTDSCHKINEYTKICKIGQGKHGHVYLCRDPNGNESAMKRIKKENLKEKKMRSLRRIQQGNAATEQDNTFRKEIEILKSCNHPNIVRLLEAIDDKTATKVYLFQENLAGGPLWESRSGSGYGPRLTLAQIRRVMKDLILGIEYLHHNGIIHRDIKPFNIIYTKDRRTVKLIDFGIAHYIPPANPPTPSNEPSSSTSTSYLKGKERARPEAPSIDTSLFPTSDLFKRLGTPAFLAPEIVWFQDDTPADQLPQSTLNSRRRVFTMPKTRPPITYAIDIWSLGVTFYGLLFDHLPFDVPADAFQNAYNSEYTIYNLICTADWEADNHIGAENMPTGGRHPEDPSRESTQIIHLLDRMLQKNPADRITVAEIKANPWILKDVANPEEWLELTSPGSITKSSSNWVKNASLKFLNFMPGSR